MKKLFILLSVVMMGIQVFSQPITVSFTGKDISNNYVQIDSIIIIDLTQNWSRKLTYPDTTADLSTVGIREQGSLTSNFTLSQNTPNPFNGATNFSLFMTDKENVTIEIHDILGRLIVDYNNMLVAGNHSFSITMNTPQIYFVTAKTKNHTSSIKIVNAINSGLAPSIIYKNSEVAAVPVQKATQSDAFAVGDTMEYVVYYNGVYSSKVKVQTSDEDYTFYFDPNIFVSKTAQNRTVLLEEFTGTNCGYCPDGHRMADSLVAVHHGVIYNMNIHAGGYAANYTTTVGTLLNNYFYVSSYPAGIVSREVVNVSGTYKYPISRASWGYVAEQLYTKPSYVNVAATASIDTTTRQLTCNVQAYFTGKSTAFNGKNYIHIAVLQDSIWGPQSNGKYFYPAMWSDALGKYCHNHMLRELILGVDGENMGGVSQGTTYQKSFTYTIPLQISSVDVVLNHLTVLVFVTEGEASSHDDYYYNRERVMYVTKSELSLTGNDE